MQDFPVKGGQINVDSALEEIAIGYLAIGNYMQEIAGISRETNFPVFFERINRLIHEFMFIPVLSNAGEFRKVTDRNSGAVYFGGEQIRQPSGSKFSGVSADLIEAEMKKTFSLLTSADKNPVRTAILFYQQYVYIHPFYDANGRIARLLVTIYLRYHGFYVRWAKLEQNKKNAFLKKLNECHKRNNKKGFDEYFDFLYQFWKDFVIPISQLNR